MACGCLVAGLGAWHLTRLERTHVREEILYSVSPQTLLLWLNSLDPQVPETVARVRDRLLLMTLPRRRNAVIALAGKEVWQQLASDPATQRAWQQVVLAATEQAVAEAPTAGDLWFLAGAIRNRLAGLDKVAQGYLELSAAYAPREMEIVIARLSLLGLAWGLLDTSLQDVVRRDLAHAGVAYPERAQEMRSYLERAGAQLDG